MRKIIGLGLIALFALSFFAGAMIDQAQAKNPIPCTYRCINQDWHKCCIYMIEGVPTEICVWHQYECTFPIYD
ncbi:MAG: hypothetical protein R3F48_17865 [Candidatus Zixiibacteriota bacterium]